MTRILAIIFFTFLFAMAIRSLAYAEHDCTRTVTCSDGAKLITTDCTSSYNIVTINGHRVYTGDDGGGNHQGPGHGSGDSGNKNNPGQDANDPDNPYGSHYHYHHPPNQPPPDPCSDNGHGHMIDDGTGSTNGASSINSSSSTSSNTPDNTSIVSDDPYGLRKHEQAVVSTNQAQ